MNVAPKAAAGTAEMRHRQTTARIAADFTILRRRESELDGLDGSTGLL